MSGGSKTFYFLLTQPHCLQELVIKDRKVVLQAVIESLHPSRLQVPIINHREVALKAVVDSSKPTVMMFFSQ